MKCHQNHAGEFIRRYSPIGMGYGAWGVGRWRTNDVGANHASEFIRRYSPIGMGHGAWRTKDVGANHAGEFIRRYSPLGRLPRLRTQMLFEDDFDIAIGFAQRYFGQQKDDN